ncbi:hypothetical protein GGR52DRAFT_151206 [Hypoxylon sp. FL1284]|nr:hypothetical protein GGR52DRAFT_151206 [Hypoxylon sp. FL1284]
MAVDEEASLWPTDNLLLKEGRKHYRTNVSPIHWQLRSLVSAERQDIVYFPAGAYNTHITRLNTTTCECETIKVISFHPRCLVASQGWVCCGGENGEFVVIRESGRDGAQEDILNSDLRSTLNAVESSNMAQLQQDMLRLVERINGSNKTWSASSHKVGTERVNCITIWHPPKDAPEVGQYDGPVAVLANNDKTITVVGLYEPDLPKDELGYPDCVNRGVISPDGSLLVAICDDPFLYIHARRPFTKHYHGVPRESHEWVQLPRIRLKGQWHQDTTDCRGSFAACFSSSGRYLAVGTQYGTISIFDAVALKDPESEPLVAYFDSDRAPDEYGAVRDMAFSPGPHDLLAWSEHRGRIGVADARTGFMRRQIISLSDPESFNHISLNERNTIDPRLLDPRSERNATSERNPGNSSLMELLGQSRPGRPLPNPNSESTDATTMRLNQPFSAEEVAILEAIQSDRRRRERERHEQLTAERNQRVNERERQIMLHTGMMASNLRRTPSYDQRREQLTRIIERERLRETRDQHRSGTSQTPPEQDRERRAPTPRRRSSIMQALTQNVDNMSQFRTQSQSQNNDGDNTSTAPQRVLARLSSELEALASMSGGDGVAHDNPPRTESSRTRRAVPVISDVWNNDALFSRIRLVGGREHQQNADDTAGLTWSEDGQILYVGAENGIYEFHINLYGRKVFPDIALR